MSEFNNCQQNLLVLAKTQGYLTFDDVLDAASTSMLSLAEIDRLSDDLQANQGFLLLIYSSGSNNQLTG